MGLQYTYMYHVYMIKNTRNQLYVGMTEDPNIRLHTHNTKQGAKFTKHAPDFKIVFLEAHTSLKEALAREVQIKKWRREKKEILIERYAKGLPTKQ